MTAVAPINQNETLELVRKALGQPGSLDVLRKAGIATTLGLVYFDLRVPSRKIYPILTPLRNEIARRAGRGGTAVNWRAVTGINTANVPGGVVEGHRNAFITLTEQDLTAPYRGLGTENYATWEAQYAAENFEDMNALAAYTGLEALMVIEERAILGGNRSFDVVRPGVITPVLADAGGALADTTTVRVSVVALTPDGLRYASAAAIQQQISRTTADGDTTAVNGGTSRPSAVVTQATGSSGAGNAHEVSVSVPVVPGAVAYAWYVGSGSDNTTMRLAAITSINSYVIKALPIAPAQLFSALADTDYSNDALMFDGLLTYGFNSLNGGYVASLATGTPGVGTLLTSDGAGGVAELNTMFAFYWNNFRLSPDAIWLHANQLMEITKLVIANGGAPLLRLTIAGQQGAEGFVAGAVVTEVINPITGQKVPLRVHPDMPAGTLMSWVKKLPPGVYPRSEIAETVEINTRQEYYQLQWPMTTRRREFGVYVDEVPVVWAPFVMGTITNIA
jgi:hypothetical protein